MVALVSQDPQPFSVPNFRRGGGKEKSEMVVFKKGVEELTDLHSDRLHGQRLLG